MNKLTRVEGIAAPLPQADIDTDMILPAQFLLRIDRAGLGQFVFHGARRAAASAGQPFILDQAPYDGASIIVGGPRFGIGSSREQAVWALHDAGIRCIIAPSFGEIFYTNCLNNGVLPVCVDSAAHAGILKAATKAQAISVDLQTQTLSIPGEHTIHFDVPPEQRRALLDGLDQTDLILQRGADAIAAFEAEHHQNYPWIAIDPARLKQFETLQESHQ